MRDRVYEMWINLVTDVNELVRLANRFEGRVQVCTEEYKVDGKSLLGVFSLDLSKPVKVYVWPAEGDLDAASAMEAFARDHMPLFTAAQ